MLEASSVSIARCPVVILNAHGLHLRAAHQFVRLAEQFESDIRVYRDGREADGRSILDLTILAADYGTRLDLEARGADAQVALAALAELISTGFHEGDDGEVKTLA